MAKGNYRRFLYIDEAEVDDLLAQAEGGRTEGPYEETERRSGQNASEDTQDTVEVRRRRSDTAQVKFNRLYDILSQEGDLRTLDEIDQAEYDSLNAREFIEIRGVARLPNWEHFKQSFAATSDLLPLMQALGQDPLADPAAREAFEGLSQLTSRPGQQDTMLIVTPPGPISVRLVAKLKHLSLQRTKEELEDDVSVVARVRRRLRTGETIDAARLLPDLEGLQTLNRAQMNRAQRRQAGKRSTTTVNTDTPFDEKVAYPAVEVQPIAIFQ